MACRLPKALRRYREFFDDGAEVGANIVEEQQTSGPVVERAPELAASSTGVKAAKARARKANLFTNEDKGRVHAVLGFLVLAHILVRLGLLVSGVPDMGFQGDGLTLACLGLHVLLGLSAFRFRVPKRRGKDGTQIWDEYRAHNGIFTLRSLVPMLCFWAEVHFGLPRLWFVRVLALYCGMLATDWVSAKESLPTTTLAGAMPQGTRAFLALFQFIGVAGLLFANNFWFNFNYVIAVQMTAFVLTLNRRRLITPEQVIALYAALILVLQPFQWAECFQLQDLAIPFWGTVAWVFRVPLGLNKYAVWTGLLAGTCAWNSGLLFEGVGAGFRIWL